MAIGYIAMHHHDGNIMADTIAKEYNIPFAYLIKVLQYMVRKGILNSKRGPHGGFVLGRKPEKITLFEIIEALDGPSSSIDLAEQTGIELFAVRIDAICEKATAAQNKLLQATTLAELVRNSKK